jgi:hypothetical protein
LCSFGQCTFRGERAEGIRKTLGKISRSQTELAIQKQVEKLEGKGRVTEVPILMGKRITWYACGPFFLFVARGCASYNSNTACGSWDLNVARIKNSVYHILLCSFLVSVAGEGRKEGRKEEGGRERRKEMGRLMVLALAAV